MASASSNKLCGTKRFDKDGDGLFMAGCESGEGGNHCTLPLLRIHNAAKLVDVHQTALVHIHNALSHY